MSVFDADARVEEVARQTLAAAISERTGQAIEDYRRERTPDALLRHALHSAGAAAILAAVVALAIWLSRMLNRLIERRYHSRIRALGIQSFEIVRAERIWTALRTALTTLRILAIAVAVFLYLDYVLGGLPWTRGFAHRLTEFFLRPLKIMGETFVREIPDLIFLVVLVLVVRFLLRLMKMFFDAVGRGSVSLRGFEAEWSLPTYKILRVVVVIFALVVNYSALAVKQGLILHTTVGIGYETPWRRVEAMLLIAADRTAGLLKEPAPFVQHKALGDFCVTYEINAYCSDAKAMNRLYTELHRNILDQFNEYGVQIMTPAYEGDPEQAKLVPKGQWYLAPAAAERSPGAG